MKFSFEGVLHIHQTSKNEYDCIIEYNIEIYDKSIKWVAKKLSIDQVQQLIFPNEPSNIKKQYILDALKTT